MEEYIVGIYITSILPWLSVENDNKNNAALSRLLHGHLFFSHILKSRTTLLEPCTGRSRVNNFL